MKKRIFLDLDVKSHISYTVSSGLLYRIILWQYFHHISQIYDCSLLVNSFDWPELEALNLPNTKIVKSNYLKGKKYHKLDSSTITQKMSLVYQNYVMSEQTHLDLCLNDEATGAGGLESKDGEDIKTFHSKIFVYLNRKLQKENSYYVKGNRVIFSNPPARGSSCKIYYYMGSHKDKIPLLDRDDPNKFMVFNSIEDKFDDTKYKFQLALTKPGKAQIAHELLRPCVNEENSLFNIDGVEHEILYYDCNHMWIDIFNAVYDRYIDFVNIHSDCAESAGFFYNFRLIKFKDDKLNHFFEDTFSDMMSVQIRRGIRAKVTPEYLEELKQYVDKNEITNFYTQVYKANRGTLDLNIYPDQYYYERIDKFIQENPNKKIYLSYDVPKSFIQHFIDRYPDHIVTRDYYLDQYMKYFDDCDFDSKKYFYPLQNSLVNLLDLFAMVHSSRMIFDRVAPHSLWKFFAQAYKHKKLY